MERTQTIGFVLIFLVLMGWLWLNTPAPEPPPETISGAVSGDSAAPGKTTETKQTEAPVSASETEPSSGGEFFGGADQGSERIITIRSDLYRAVLSTKGARIQQWELTEYQTWSGHPVQLVDFTKGDLSMLFGTSDGKTLTTDVLYFDATDVPAEIVLDSKNFKFEINFTLKASNGGRLIKTYRFQNDIYGVDVVYTFDRLNNVIANYEYEITWDNGVPFAERNSVDESGFAGAYAFAGQELTEIDASDIGERVEKAFGGQVDWVSIRNKYFAAAMVPVYPETEGAILQGTRRSVVDEGVIEDYAMALRMPFKGSAKESSMVRLYLGPLEHETLGTYDAQLEKMMSLGWAWIIRPIAEYIFLPLFTSIHYVVPNWGIVIIIFSIIIKIVLHPLTKTSMRSMKRMQALQPLMEELKEKYKDEPQKMNQAVMGLYKEYGVNPAGGCLPLLLQMPILYALFAMFRSAIELRQAEFVGWITDLSVPDVLFTLPFKLPLFGLDEVSGIALLMGVSMFVQQKMSVKDPRQKMMVWMMPVMFTLLFNSFPSGLNLYYAVFNVLSIGQQYVMNKKDDEPLRKVEPKKKGRGGIFKNMPDIKQLQQRKKKH